jgi:hypothetical protein
MSGTAALSAARKRRASTVQTPGQMLNGGTPMSYSNTPNPYYNSGQQQQQLPQGYLGRGMPGAGAGPGLGGISLIPQNMTIHENIELIKTQMDQRLQLINTKGRTMPPEKLKMLQKQQEIQMQILKQKIAIAQEMEEDEDNEPPHFPTQQQQQQPAPAPQKQPPPPKVEPPIIYDRGIPRPNPKYVAPNPNDVTVASPAPAPAPAPVNISAAAPIQAQKQQPAPQSYKQSQQQSNRSVMPTATLTPFVSMTSAGGAIPPPIVILKSHDDKIGEHDAVLNDLTNRVNYIHSRIDQVERNGSLQQQQQQQQQQDQIKHYNDSAKGHVTFDQKRDADDAAAEAADDDDEPMILMTEVISDLLDSREFMQGVVDKIMNETNLAEVIFKIDPIIKENQELRSLIHSQQETMNQMNTMLLKFLNTQAEIMLSSNRDSSRDSNRHDVQTDCSVIDETHEVCNEDGLYEDWQNNVSLQVQDQQEQQVHEEHEEQEQEHEHEDQEPEHEEQEREHEEHDQQMHEEHEEQEHEHEEQDQEPEEEEKDEVPEQCQTPEQTQEQPQEQPVQDEQLTTEVVDNEHDTTSDNEVPSFPDMNRLKLLVSEIPESDM